MKNKHRVSRAVNMVILFILAVIAVFPLLWTFSSSFRPDTEIYQYAFPLQWHTFVPVEFTAEAYKMIFTEFNFWRPIINTLFVSLVIVIAGCLVNSLAAFGFAVFPFRGKSALYGIVLLSFMIPFESIAVPLYKVVDQLKWVDTYWGLVVPTIADGFAIFLFVQFFKNIQREFFEAARIDGATWMQIYGKIILPLSKPVLVTAALMTFINQWNSFLWPLLVAHGKEIRLIQVALSDFTAEHVTLWSCLYAASVISALIPLVLFLPFQKYYVGGITSGGVKG